MVRDIAPTATSVAIVAEDLLRVCQQRIEVGGDQSRRPVARLLGWLGRGWTATRGLMRPRVVTEYRQRPRCAVCAQLLITEAHCLDAVLHFAEDPEFDRAYQRSSGLCVPHLVGAVERGCGAPGVATVVERTLVKWQTLRHNLERFVAKHEYRNVEAISVDEASAPERTLAILAGSRGLFGNDIRRNERPRNPEAAGPR